MASKHVFYGVTLDVLRRLRAQDDEPYELELDPDRIRGRLIKHTGMGDVIVHFEHNDARAEMAITIARKPMLLPTPVLLAEMSAALREASQEASRAAAAQAAVGSD